jgi:hypothetical protein
MTVKIPKVGKKTRKDKFSIKPVRIKRGGGRVKKLKIKV